MMSAYKTPLVILLIYALFLSFTAALVSDSPSAYEMLERFNFPKGILPEGVQSYTLHQDGSFEVFLSEDCEFKVDGGYLLNYKKKITGQVQSGSLTNLRGVDVKVVLLWFRINGVVRSGGDLSFYVGPLSASFSLSNFEECPKCHCGFDCATPALVADS